MFALLRLIMTLVIIGGIVYGAMFAIDFFVEPQISEQTDTFILRAE